jgi:hypothetical protein
VGGNEQRLKKNIHSLCEKNKSKVSPLFLEEEVSECSIGKGDVVWIEMNNPLLSFLGPIWPTLAPSFLSKKSITFPTQCLSSRALFFFLQFCPCSRLRFSDYIVRILQMYPEFKFRNNVLPEVKIK